MTTPKQKNIKYHGKDRLFFVLLFILSLFLMINIYSSQTISPIYFSFINEDRSAAISYLKGIKNLPFFSSELLRYKNTYGSWVEDQVFKTETERKNKIAQLEEALKRNNKSRDILIALSVLYKQDGNEHQARMYLNKAKEVDPTVTIKE